MSKFIAAILFFSAATATAGECHKTCSGSHVEGHVTVVEHAPPAWLASHQVKKEEGKDIVDTAVSVEDFSTLVAAVKAAGLVEALKSDGPFTVFAPTNEAFEKLPEGVLADLLKPENKDKLTSILLYHVVPGAVMAKDVVTLESAPTLLEEELVKIKVEEGKVYVNQAQVVKTDIVATNGVIHVIDAVLLP